LRISHRIYSWCSILIVAYSIALIFFRATQSKQFIPSRTDPPWTWRGEVTATCTTCFGFVTCCSCYLLTIWSPQVVRWEQSGFHLLSVLSSTLHFVIRYSVLLILCVEREHGLGWRSLLWLILDISELSLFRRDIVARFKITWNSFP